MPTANRRRRAKASAVNPKVSFQYIDITDIAPYEFNPRDNEAAIESVANSIQSFGFLVPVVLDANNVLAAGHTRIEAAKTLGLNEVPAVFAEHLSEDQIAAFRIIDNKVSELARWDFDLLSGELSSLQQSGIEFTRYGFTQEEIDCLTDVVSEDCLSAGAVTSMEERSRRGRAEKRAPAQTRFVLGEFVFFIPADVYKRWAAMVRNECDYDDKEIARVLKDNMRISDFEDDD